MNQKLHQAFKNITQINPPLDLKERTLARLDTQKQHALKRRLMGIYTGLTASAAALAYVLIFFSQTIFQSDFWNLLTLAYSDTGIVLSHWNDFLISLLETIPVMNITLILIPIFAILLLTGFFIDAINQNRRRLI